MRLEDTESEEEEDPETETTQENASLRANLAKAQEKIVVMASTIEQIHRSMEPLVARLRTAAKIMRTAAKEGTFAKPEQAESLTSFAKDNKEIVNGVLDPLNLGVEEMNKRLPKMGDRVFQHLPDGPTTEFLTWAAQPSNNFEKLEDPDDKYD